MRLMNFDETKDDQILFSTCTFLTGFDSIPPEIANADSVYLQKFEASDLNMDTSNRAGKAATSDTNQFI